MNFFQQNFYSNDFVLSMFNCIIDLQVRQANQPSGTKDTIRLADVSLFGNIADVTFSSYTLWAVQLLKDIQGQQCFSHILIYLDLIFF